MYVDAHCHLDDPSLAADAAGYLSRAAAVGVTGYVVAGVDPASWARQRALAAWSPGRIRWTAGLHPCAVAAASPAEVEAALAALPEAFRGDAPATGLGETGLDTRFCPRSTLPAQLDVFRASLALARDLEVPVVLHLNGDGTHARALELMRRDGLPRAGGMVHACSASAEVATQYVALGLHVSFAGTVCRSEARRVHAAARAVPAHRLLVETDAPDLTPPGLPRPNESAALVHVARAVADVRGEVADAVLTRCATACAELFGGFTLPRESTPRFGESHSCPRCPP